MSSGWAIRIPLGEAQSIAALRGRSGIEVGLVGEEVWVRSKYEEGPLTLMLKGLPATERYEWLSDDRLRPERSRIPSEKMPAASWIPVAAWLTIERPTPALPAIPPKRVPLRLERSAGREQRSSLLLTAFESWAEFARSAPSLRLSRLKFAVANDKQVVVHGSPLPPLPGTHFTLHGNIAVPAGFFWTPAVSSEVVRHLIGLPAESIAIWFEDGSISRIDEELFVQANRSAVKATAEELV